MGKGRIVSGGAEGLYFVEMLTNRARIDAELQALAEQIAQLDDELSALETEREGLVDERNWIATQIDQAVAAAPEGELPDVEALLVELAQASAQVQAIDVRIAMTKGRRLQARKRQQALEAVPEDPVQQAWCADLTENLAGDVGTIELPGEGTVGEFLTWRRLLIRPGYSGAASYSSVRDGQLFHRIGMSPEQAFYNAAILPGWQRWMPLHRIGVLTSVDAVADTCSLNLQSEDSSAQSLIIDPPGNTLTLTGVPIQYMNCNAAVFEVGDRVVVELQGQDWDQPRVIGFETNPRPCGAFRIFELSLLAFKGAADANFFTGGEVGVCSGPSDNLWYSRLPFLCQTSTLDGFDEFFRSCDFDPTKTNFEGQCHNWSYTLPTTEVAAVAPTGDENITAGTWVTGTLANEVTQSGVTVYQSITLDHSNYTWTGIKREFEADTVGDACVNTGTVANEQAVNIVATTLPDIILWGTWKPIAFVRIRQQAASPTESLASVVALRVLYERQDDAPE